jgi:ssDNA-binding Zn-finger/Zn-ribbon topoisomerase 1
MCDVKKYNKEVFKVGDIVNVICPMCDGRGRFNVTRAIDQFTDEVDYEICPKCNGEGNLEKKLRKCPHCRELVSEDDLTWVYDRYGIPYKKVCWDCYGEVGEEIGNYEYNYLDAGEYLEVEDY